MNYFVSAIGTDSGKTLVSAILVQMLGADYWKPVQSGSPTDTNTLRSLVRQPNTVFHPSAYTFQLPASPHAAAAAEGRNIVLEAIQLPASHNKHLVIEGAGGLLVPLNQEHFVVDLVERFDCELILVSNLYLGSINHTLLSIQEIRRRGLRLKGIVFNGAANPASSDIILHHAQCPCLGHIAVEEHIDADTVQKYADLWADQWSQGFVL